MVEGVAVVRMEMVGDAMGSPWQLALFPRQQGEKQIRTSQESQKRFELYVCTLYVYQLAR